MQATVFSFITQTCFGVLLKANIDCRKIYKTVDITYFKNWLMTTFELRTSGVVSDCSTN